MAHCRKSQLRLSYHLIRWEAYPREQPNARRLSQELRPLERLSMRIRPYFALVALVWLGAGIGAFGQTSSSGAITGVVVDVTGSAISGVQLRLSATDSHSTKYSVSDEKGSF